MDCIYAWVLYASLIMKVACYVFDLILVLFWPIPYPVVQCELLWIVRNVNKELNW
jgi:hypothetical protein